MSKLEFCPSLENDSRSSIISTIQLLSPDLAAEVTSELHSEFLVGKTDGLETSPISQLRRTTWHEAVLQN